MRLQGASDPREQAPRLHKTIKGCSFKIAKLVLLFWSILCLMSPCPERKGCINRRTACMDRLPQSWCLLSEANATRLLLVLHAALHHTCAPVNLNLRHSWCFSLESTVTHASHVSSCIAAPSLCNYYLNLLWRYVSKMLLLLSVITVAQGAVSIAMLSSPATITNSDNRGVHDN